MSSHVNNFVHRFAFNMKDSCNMFNVRYIRLADISNSNVIFCYLFVLKGYEINRGKQSHELQQYFALNWLPRMIYNLSKTANESNIYAIDLCRSNLKGVAILNIYRMAKNTKQTKKVFTV